MVHQYLKRFWHFLWEEDSIYSWVANVVIAFVLIKYIIFPVLGLILGSQFPVVAVVSRSMEHDGTFDQWWTSQALCDSKICTQEELYKMFDITKEEFEEFKFKNGFNKGDVMVLTSAKNAKVGDTIVFISKANRPIIHRVIDLDPLQTKGDHNQAQIVSFEFSEKNVSAYHVVGKASLRIPFIGYVKIIFSEIMGLFGVNVS